MGKSTKRAARETLKTPNTSAEQKTHAGNYLKDCREGRFQSGALGLKRYGAFAEHDKVCYEGFVSSDKVRRIAQAYNNDALRSQAQEQARREKEDGSCCCTVS